MSELLCALAILLLGIHTRKNIATQNFAHMNIQGSSIHNVQEVEKPKCLVTNEWINRMGVLSLPWNIAWQ